MDKWHWYTMIKQWGENFNPQQTSPCWEEYPDLAFISTLHKIDHAVTFEIPFTVVTSVF